jgi:hypothetical protein
VLFDLFVLGIYEGTFLSEVDFNLLEQDNNGKIVSAHSRGVWFMVDKGYLSWPTTVPPMKDAIKYNNICFSKWLENMRKDVEYTFGILRGSFRILKTGVQVHGVEATVKIWLTCCALHNFLLEADGLHGEWNNGVPSNWEEELGCHNGNDVNEFSPPALLRAF